MSTRLRWSFGAARPPSLGLRRGTPPFATGFGAARPLRLGHRSQCLTVQARADRELVEIRQFPLARTVEDGKYAGLIIDDSVSDKKRCSRDH